LDNAVKFSPHGGQIKLGIEENADTVSVSVTNSGSGINPENRDKIFRKFYQADESHSSEGSGVGLAIVKRVVELHSGSVEAESSNGLTVFTVSLPKLHN
ncbi:MAG: GHKL domain-containing protein, partial [Clostridia bacterium]|nr:GHKL domain-containing protein [Clostridia bacterium]